MSYAHTEVAQIAAIAQNRCIGKDNMLPWHISADLKHFKALTTHHDDTETETTTKDGMQATPSRLQGIVIMGRKTFESMNSKPLPNRANFIITTQMDYAQQHGLADTDNTYVMHNLDDAITQAASLAHGAKLKTIWVIGGERVFSDAMRYTDRVELTHVDTEISDGDAFYPELPNDFIVTAESAQQYDEGSGLTYTFTTYQRDV